MIDEQALRRRVRELPALPQAAMAAAAALRDERSSSAHCSELIGRDQALAARVLRLANSAFYGVPGRVGSIRDAVQLLGRRTLSSVLTVATLSQQFHAADCLPFSFAGFWRHAIGVALAARGLARALDHDEDLAFTVGLLHDIGNLALATHFADATAHAIAHARAADASLHAAERSLLGIDHADVGALVAAHWQFPAGVVAAIAGHHAPEGGGALPTRWSTPSTSPTRSSTRSTWRTTRTSWSPTSTPPRGTGWPFRSMRCCRCSARPSGGVEELCRVLGL